MTLLYDGEEGSRARRARDARRRRACSGRAVVPQGPRTVLGLPVVPARRRLRRAVARAAPRRRRDGGVHVRRVGARGGAPGHRGARAGVPHERRVRVAQLVEVGRRSVVDPAAGERARRAPRARSRAPVDRRLVGWRVVPGLAHAGVRGDVRGDRPARWRHATGPLVLRRAGGEHLLSRRRPEPAPRAGRTPARPLRPLPPRRPDVGRPAWRGSRRRAAGAGEPPRRHPRLAADPATELGPQRFCDR